MTPPARHQEKDRPEPAGGAVAKRGAAGKGP